MKKYPAMASIEFNGVAIGMYATDALLKKSPISLIKCGTISRGRYLTIIGGSTGSVLESLEEGLFWGKDSVVDHTFLPDIHPCLHDAVLGKRYAATTGALAIFESQTVSSMIQATEMALKGCPVDLIELRLGDTQMGGRGLTILQGTLHDIEAARDIALSFFDNKGIEVMHSLLTSPHEAMVQHVDSSTMYHKAKEQELDGEHA